MNKNSLTRGVIFIHSTPRALCPHIEWAISHVLETEIKLQWTKQSIDEKVYRTEHSWIGQVATGAKLASALRGWEHLRYEITEEPTLLTDGGRWVHTPELGIFYSQMDRNGNMLISENRVRAVLEYQDDPKRMIHELKLALGNAWDEELEPFRQGSDGDNLRWLHRTE
ncbi:DUF3145 domain-containing protein [Actinomyces sp. zg-332]|uniref:DUF3145 domain-containing protein n=1 Tax=Actinomyces sp. zg-332 TaxID=2708340 RepID=UPI0014216F85|nr:DUF3145 domain-containing protein [Actinomyces sp. zg-332]QPK93681.1 DUF3145 domain-containing protein [Actinomyces sp. zg-332]